MLEVEGLGRQRQANDGDSCDCLDLSPSALVHRQRLWFDFQSTSAPDVPSYMPGVFVCVCMRVTGFWAMDVWTCDHMHMCRGKLHV